MFVSLLSTVPNCAGHRRRAVDYDDELEVENNDENDSNVQSDHSDLNVEMVMIVVWHHGMEHKLIRFKDVAGGGHSFDKVLQVHLCDFTSKLLGS